ncbi:MAG: cation:proton antiporter [Thermoplasmata archaeon]|nr:cation:proton antiporter [Thermoplasmata archaeon]
MEEAVILTALAMFTLLAAICSIVFNKLNLPPLIGYIVAGIVMVNVLFLYQDAETQEAEEELIEILKAMGLVMLMFCIGLEINIKKIRKQGSFAILVAVIQLPLMVLGGFIAGTLMGYDMTQSIVLGAIISGSSTAVVMAVLKSQNRLDKEHIEMLVLITIMEDIGQVIILSMITPLMANYAAGLTGGMELNDIIVLIVKILLFMIVSIVVGLRIIPRVINWISDNVSDEILTITSVGLAFGMALLATYAGLSMAVGAFLMGMMVASSRKAKEINHKIEPMRDLFMAIFFISIGAEIYPASILLDNITTIVIFFLLFFCMKTCTVFLAYWVGNESCRNGFLSATGLCAMGEFAFIIAAEALNNNVVDESFYTSVIGAALLSMICLPIVCRYADRFWDKSVEKCPRKVYAACCSVNEARTRMYERVSATSKKSQKAVFKSMTHAYINIFVIAIIEIAFYFILPPLSDWGASSFGGDVELWRLLILGINFIVLTAPTYYMINNVKFLDEMIISGAKRIANREGADSNPIATYERFLNFLEINTYLLIMAIDFVIILIVPNAVPIPMWFYAAVLAIALLCVVAMYLKKRRQSKLEMEAAAAEDAAAEEELAALKESLNAESGESTEEPAPESEPEETSEGAPAEPERKE